MHETTFSHLRNQAKHCFDLVESGEVIRVLRNGRPIAEIHPIPAGLPSWKQGPACPLTVSGVELGRLIVDGLGDDGFIADRRTQQAVILNIVVIGEAATRLAAEHPEFTQRFSDVPRKSMRGMRNRMAQPHGATTWRNRTAHGYFDIDLAIVWQTVHSSLPELASRLIETRDRVAGSGGPSRDEG